LEAVCSGVKQKPDICYQAGAFNKGNTNKESSGLSVWTILSIIILIILVNGLIYFICRRYITKSISDRVSSNEIDDRINTVVSSYIAFKDQDKK
jgi:uncharacterized protein YneF (UPF0154 family)